MGSRTCGAPRGLTRRSRGKREARLEGLERSAGEVVEVVGLDLSRAHGGLAAGPRMEAVGGVSRVWKCNAGAKIGV